MSADSPLCFDAWLDKNQQDLACIAAETGMDRELDFNQDLFEENSYDEYLGSFNRKTIIDYLSGGSFLGKDNGEFSSFIADMPEAHWSKYDLSAIRLGWEAHKKLGLL